jgi:sigma-B regulation protein RsbU (phosphoserine phosphatase)
MLEIARYLDSANAPLWGLRRSLIINFSAALALLASLGLIAWRFRAYLAGQRLERQLAIARQVQEDLLPAGRPIAESFDIAASCQPASQVGGDLYDTFPTPAGGHALVLGDVSGKGVPAALLMGVLHGAVRSSSWTDSVSAHLEATRRLNQLLCEHASRERFASLFWGYFEPRTGRFHYVNAGHCPPVVVRADGLEPVTLDEGGPVLGLLPGVDFRQGSIALEPGDTLILYSDGVVETAAAGGDMFGEERLAEALAGAARLDAGEVRDSILDRLAAFAPGSELADDRTLLVARYTGAAEFALAPRAA